MEEPKRGTNILTQSDIPAAKALAIQGLHLEGCQQRPPQKNTKPRLKEWLDRGQERTPLDGATPYRP